MVMQLSTAAAAAAAAAVRQTATAPAASPGRPHQHQPAAAAAALDLGDAAALIAQKQLQASLLVPVANPMQQLLLLLLLVAGWHLQLLAVVRLHCWHLHCWHLQQPDAAQPHITDGQRRRSNAQKCHRQLLQQCHCNQVVLRLKWCTGSKRTMLRSY
jgi:hypothetical protein